MNDTIFLCVHWNALYSILNKKDNFTLMKHYATIYYFTNGHNKTFDKKYFPVPATAIHARQGSRAGWWPRSTSKSTFAILRVSIGCNNFAARNV